MNKMRKEINMTNLKTNQLEALIRWNENGNDTLENELYNKEDLVYTIETYIEDQTLSELIKEAQKQCLLDSDRLKARGIKTETIVTILEIK